MTNKRSISPLRRRRLARFVLFLSVVLSLSLGVMPRLIAADHSTPGRVRTHVVANGESLWAIASKYGVGEDPRRYVHELQMLNGLEGAAVFPGQRLKLP